MKYRISPFCLLLAAVAIANAQDPGPLVSDAKAAWTTVSSNIVKAAEEMPEENYSFRPTEEVRSFGQLIGHVTDANYLFCSAVSAEKKSPPGAEKSLKAKEDLVQALKESVAYCSATFAQATSADVAKPVKLFGAEKTQLSVLYMNIAHSNEHYGNIVTYLRLKGFVPPSSAPRAAAVRAVRLYFDRAHGEFELPDEMGTVAKKLNLEIANEQQPITAGTLQGSRLIYLRAPSKTFGEEEKKAIVDFVKHGGSLLLVQDEEKRQKLAVTGVNDLLSPFDMRLTLDTEYLPNPGAIAIAGEINQANREVPYDGGRAVEGGTPFAFQLDKEGKPGQPYAAWQKVEGGGRIVVMGEGMASLFMGTPAGQRLVPVRANTGENYFGKDSAIFMEEVFTWLVNAKM